MSARRARQMGTGPCTRERRALGGAGTQGPASVAGGSDRWQRRTGGGRAPRGGRPLV